MRLILEIFKVGIIFFLGFYSGYSHHFENKKEIKSTQQSTKTTENVSQKIDTNKVTYIERYYSKKGILNREVVHENSASENSSITDLNVVNAVTSKTSSTTEINPQSNYSLGFLIPPHNHPNLIETNFQFGYRLVGPIYVLGQTDILIRRPMIGFSVNF